MQGRGGSMIELWKTILKIHKILQWGFLIICILQDIIILQYLHFLMQSTYNHMLPCKP